MITPLPLENTIDVEDYKELLIEDDLINEINEMLEKLPEFVGV